MKILLIDAYDSFVYIIKNYLNVLLCDVDVVRCDKVDTARISNSYNVIILGPGPGHPKESGYLDILTAFENKKPIFGVCLGMQAIVEHYGIPVGMANHRRHGKTSDITHTGAGCFIGLPNPLKVTRYHSLIVDENQFNHQALDITARANDDGYIMGIKHKRYAIEGVQFHPESVTTEKGTDIFSNFLKSLKNIKRQE